MQIEQLADTRGSIRQTMYTENGTSLAENRNCSKLWGITETLSRNK